MLNILLLPFKILIWIVLLPFKIVKLIVVGSFNLIIGIFRSIGFILGGLLSLLFCSIIFGFGWFLVGGILTNPIYWIIFLLSLILAVPAVIFISWLDKKKDQSTDKN